MKKPNFFIIGAPKCGTTSMTRWLAEHPNIYMSPMKEPNFFNTDDRWTMTRTLHQYEALFRDAGPDHVAVGEASVWYLFSREAVPNILAYCENPKFLVMIRNPIEMAYSLHQQELYSGNEHIKDFQEAWELQSKRANGLEISRFCVEPKRLLYGPACKLGEQLERLYALVPDEKVLVLVLDYVRKNPRHEYIRVLRFLGVPDDGRTNFPVYNSAKERRSPFIGKAIAFFGRTVGGWKRSLGIQRGLGVLNALNKANTLQRNRPPLDERTWQQLADYFAEDIRKLLRLLERDLSYWLDFPSADQAENSVLRDG